MGSRRTLIALGAAFVLAVGVVGSASAGGRSLTTHLSGGAEVPGPGDPDGSGTARIWVNPGRQQVCWNVTWSNITAPSAAHIHIGFSDLAGPVVVGLDPIASGCTHLSRAKALAIIKAPNAFYVNVHNSDFPPGAIRGQLG